ncbi:MAG TPA: hypothetical protein VIH82_04765 [Acidimicrobiia bacterium]|jgi:hypothetical protein
MTRRLTHVELVYRPGERPLAVKLFDLLGCRPVDRGGVYFTAFIEPAESDYVTNVLYASEVTPAQWELEQALHADAAVAGPMHDYVEHLRREPQRSFHFGLRVTEQSTLEELIDRIATAGEHDPDLAGRVGVAGVFRPGDEGSITDTMIQAFVWTDIVAAGLLTLGQHIELQWNVPAAPEPASAR